MIIAFFSILKNMRNVHRCLDDAVASCNKETTEMVQDAVTMVKQHLLPLCEEGTY